ncbi:bifunctional serine/threonine-protein kinase/ABC transporter substrate-binding protein [Streptomyces sp. NPDC050560]|uniref:bifunctional serine/threonine-protein kinase/ABC transporter substrate-binding protein n=1 Tax=Streptomyces sp. NPDC050560 TaxID=3365630 RepID=UPI003787E71A
MEPLLPGDPASVGGHRLLGRLGAGGMGLVYLARSPGGALTALKVIRAGYAQEPSFRARFRREAEAAGRVTSRWVVPVTAADPESPAPWLATPYVPGPSLAEAVAACGPLPEHTVRVLGVRLAGALTAVHEAGLVHRDVKPGNVLLAPDGPRLIDFGIARTADATALTSADAVVGSPGFLSPEQARGGGGEVGPASDVFSLGCVLAYVASGVRPFGAGSAASVLLRTVYDEPDLSGVPGALTGVVAACLAKEAAARPGPGRLAELLAAGGEPARGEGWLPPAVSALIAERSARVIELPDIAATEPGTLAAGAAGGGLGRRRLLALGSSAGVLAAGGGLAAWAAGRGGGAPPPRRTLGVHTTLSGPGADTGRALRDGATLAVERFNARGDRPFTLRLRTLDDRGGASGARDVAARMAGDPEVTAVLGPSGEATALAAAESYGDAGLAAVCVAAASDALTSYGTKSVFQPRADASALALPVLSFLVRAVDSALTSLVLDRAGGDPAWQLVDSVARSLGQERRTRTHTVPSGTRDFTGVAGEVAAAKPDAVFFAGGPERAALLARALDAAGFSGPRCATETVLTPAFLAGAGAAAEGWTLAAAFTDASADPRARDFSAAFRRRFGHAPPRWAAEAYDTVGFLASGLRSLGTEPERGALVRELREGRYEGVTRSYRFDATTSAFHVSGDEGRREGLYLYRVDKGAFRFLGDFNEALDRP